MLSSVAPVPHGVVAVHPLPALNVSVVGPSTPTAPTRSSFAWRVTEEIVAAGVVFVFLASAGPIRS